MKKLRPRRSLNERAIVMKVVEKLKEKDGFINLLITDEMMSNPSNRKERRMAMKWNVVPTARRKYLNGKKGLKIG